MTVSTCGAKEVVLYYFSTMTFRTDVQAIKQQSGDLAAFGFQLKKLKYIERFAEAAPHKCP